MGVALVVALFAGVVATAAPAHAASGDPVEYSYIGWADDTYDHQFKCPAIPVEQMPNPDDVSYCEGWTHDQHDSSIWIQWYVEHRHPGGNDGFWVINSERFSFDGATTVDLGAYAYLEFSDCVFPWFFQHNTGYSPTAFTGIDLRGYSLEPRHGNHVKYSNCNATGSQFIQNVTTWDAYNNQYVPRIDWNQQADYNLFGGGGQSVYYLNEQWYNGPDNWDPHGQLWLPANGATVTMDVTTASPSGLTYTYSMAMFY